MGISGLSLLLSGLFLCLGLASAVVARAAARDARAICRAVRSDLNELELETTRHSAAIKRMSGQIGALGRWSAKQPDQITDNGLPDPNVNPDKWRAAVRLLAINRKESK
jgi:hypothetical protein